MWMGSAFAITWTPESPDRIQWCWLELGGAALMLQEVKAKQGGAPDGAQRFSVCFMCRDALAIYRDAIAKGLTPKGPFVGNTLWVVSFTDPDGFSVDFESPTDVAEETEYDPALHG